MSLSGFISGWVVGAISVIVGFDYMAGLLAFYISASYMTKMGAEKKKKQEEDYIVGGERNLYQVLATCGIGTIIAIIILIFRPVDNKSLYILRLCYVCHYCVVNGDTWASELGSIYGGIPRLVTTMKKVPPGTNGGITIFGLLISFAGGSFVTLWFHLITCLIDSFLTFSSCLEAALIGGIFGFLGSFVILILYYRLIP